MRMLAAVDDLALRAQAATEMQLHGPAVLDAVTTSLQKGEALGSPNPSVFQKGDHVSQWMTTAQPEQRAWLLGARATAHDLDDALTAVDNLLPQAVAGEKRTAAVYADAGDEAWSGFRQLEHTRSEFGYDLQKFKLADHLETGLPMSMEVSYVTRKWDRLLDSARSFQAQLAQTAS